MQYLDTSFLAPYFLSESSSAEVQRYLSSAPLGELAISHWTRVEFSSVVALRCRLGTLDSRSAKEAEVQFETITAKSFTIFLPDIDDFSLAKTYLSNFPTGLRGGDALHLAIAHNRNVDAIRSFDKQMIKAGRILGLPVSAEFH